MCVCDEARKEQLKDGRRQAVGTLGSGEHAVGMELQHGEGEEEEEEGRGRGRRNPKPT